MHKLFRIFAEIFAGSFVNFLATLKILSKNDELQISFLHGKRFYTPAMPDYLKETYPIKIKAYFKFIIFLARNCGFKRSIATEGKILFFYSSQNQFNAINKVYRIIKEKRSTILVKTKKNMSYSSAPISLKLNLMDVIYSVVILVMRTRRLNRKIRESCTTEKSQIYNFFIVYPYLIMCLKILRSSRALLVVTSNDHNVSNCALYCAADYLNLRICYLQHGTTNEYFPQLNFDHVFLDGEFAAQKYKKCRDPFNFQNKLGKIYLVGNFKSPVLQDEYSKRSCVGVAVNILDDLNIIQELCNKIIRQGFDVNIRWHPAQPELVIKSFAKSFLNNQIGEKIKTHRACEVPIEKYLNSIRCLISGTSSIAFDAVLHSVPSGLIQSADIGSYDYYGFLENKISIDLENQDLLINFIQKPHLYFPSKKSIQFFSKSYGTKNQGREGNLIAKILSNEF